ncbi:MAG: C13 family peptidase [Gammaproteobacteria bacterium]
MLKQLLIILLLLVSAACARHQADVPLVQEQEIQGRALLADGAIYEGMFKDGLMHGRGTLRWPNGERYEGEFRNGLMHGQGRYYFFPDGREGAPMEKLAGRWERGEFVSERPAPSNEAGEPALVPELVLFQQFPLLTRRLQTIAPSRPGVPDLYVIAFGADGHQDVFMKEAAYVHQLFSKRYGTAGRSLLLVNNRKALHEVPLASASNLRRALKIMARRMDVEEDILLLYFTSHGSRDHEIAVQLENLPLVNLSPPLLATLFKEAGIKWKVIVISACYSGGFIDALKDDHTMVITSAHGQRSSFGCSDDADMTYFGRAFFQQALPRTDSFRHAFEMARKLVSAREKEKHFKPSLPQMSSSPEIEARLVQWRATLPTAAAE